MYLPVFNFTLFQLVIINGFQKLIKEMFEYLKYLFLLKIKVGLKIQKKKKTD